jgi:response regulator RpfG family c-di-GMP phosphodiesterase
MTRVRHVIPRSDRQIATSAASGPGGGIRVLVVDDEPAACKLLALLLAPPAFHCTTASGGQAALSVLAREPVDAIVSDLRMPGMDGMKLLSEARLRHPRVAFLVTTGIDDVEFGVQAMGSGADNYLVNPLQESMVVAGLERALHKQHLEQEVEKCGRCLEEMVAERTEQLRGAQQKIEAGYEETLEALAAAMDLRDSETAGHSDRVCQYSLTIGQALGLSGEELTVIAPGGYLHDIGKLGIPDSVLLKPGPLSPDERELMQQHVQIGFDPVKGVPFLSSAAEIIPAYHERYDGSGYPNSLAEDEIPLSARIFAVAGTLSAITSDRPYRRASPFEVARETIGPESGRQFAPDLVRLFLSIPEETRSTIALQQRGPRSSRPRLEDLHQRSEELSSSQRKLG